jgi:hypothetical protein
VKNFKKGVNLVKMMLFLGAGASKPFGIKTMEEMSEEFGNKADSLLNDEEKLYQEIRSALGTNNLEDILSVSYDLGEKVLNPTVRYLKSQFKKIASPKLEGDLKEVIELVSSTFTGIILEKNLPKVLQPKIIHFIKENCVLQEEEERLRDIIGVYDRLFDILKIKTSSCDIFTTNYDLVIEKYYDLHTGEYYLFRKKYNYVEKRKISYTDGFLFRVFKDSLITSVVNEDVWDPRRYDGAKYAYSGDIPALRLFKLHGSIDQYYQNGGIVKNDTLFPTKTVDGIELKDSMIYPMREKEVYKDPFFELFTRLKTSLLSEKICIVIGYSFGDEHIRNIFFDAVKRNPKIKILYGDKNLDGVIKNLEQIKDNIIPIEGEFGEEAFFERLEEEFEKCKSSN